MKHHMFLEKCLQFLLTQEVETNPGTSTWNLHMQLSDRNDIWTQELMKYLTYTLQKNIEAETSNFEVWTTAAATCRVQW